MTAVGVDGWRGQWVAATVRDGRTEWAVHDRFASVLAGHPDATIAVDMPVGVLGGPRASDAAAREFLRDRGGPWQSVFLTPDADAVAAYEAGR